MTHTRPRPLCRSLALAGFLSLVAAGCDQDPTATPTPAPTVTVTATETVTDAPTTPPTTVDPCDALVGGESLAFVFVTAPTPGTQVSSGFTFSGCSNTFEASHQWRLLDQGGNVLAQGFGTATCGTGCVGTFQQSVTFTVTDPEVGTLEVFTTSAEDGSVQDLNAIPLVLQP